MSYPRIKAGSRALKHQPHVFQPANPAKQSPPHVVSEKAKTLATRGRMEKAERDERVDITKALTPVKT